MIADLKELYVRAARFALLCPLLFAVPIAVEFAQHVAEMHLGIYASLAQAKASEMHPLRIGIGHLKVVSLFLMGYWFIRFLGAGDDPAAARRVDPKAVRLFLGVMAWGLFGLVLTLDGQVLLNALGAPQKAVALFMGLLTLVSFLIEPFLSGWKTAAPQGDDRIGFLASFGFVGRTYWWGLGFTILAILPPMAAHYALFLGAIGKGAVVQWGLIAVDSVLVSYLGAVIVGVSFFIARRAAAARRFALQPASVV